MNIKKLLFGIIVILWIAGVSVVYASATGASSAQDLSTAGTGGLSEKARQLRQASSESRLPDFGRFQNLDIQAPAQATSTWLQVNSSGFGDPQELEVSAVEAFNGFLYAGTHNPIDAALLFDGARIFRSSDGATWTPVTQPGFGNSHDIAPPAILDFVVFNNQLYAGTGRGNASQIWRTSNGSIWAPMDVTGFSDPDNVDITALAVYNGMIYAGVTNQVTGAQIWRSFTGDNNTWTQIAPETPGTAVSSITGFAEFGGALYAAVESAEVPVQIWQSFGGAWTEIMSDGFGDNNTLMAGGLAVFGNYLYVGAGNATNGAQLWRTNDGATWQQAVSPGFGDPNNQKVEMMFVYQNQLYASLRNVVTGMEIWRSSDGMFWEQDNLDGFGDINNTGTNLNSATANFLGQLYVGTSNLVDGGELWRTGQQPNNPPTNIFLFNASVDENLPANTVVGTLTAVDPDAGAVFTFSLACAVAGADDGSFNILGSDLRTSAVFDFETRSSYSICVRVTDQGGLSFDKSFVVTVNDVFENAAPTDITLSNASVDENLPAHTVVGSLTAADPDAGAVFTFSLTCAVAGADDGSFNILGAELRTSAVFDFETKSSYSICLRVTDQGGLSFDKNFVVTVNDVFENAAPVDIFLSANTVDENLPANTVVGALTAADPDAGATFTFSLACSAPGADDGSFNILGADLRTSAVFDFETRSNYSICVRVTDQGGLTFEKNFVVTVNDVFDATNTPGKVTGGGMIVSDKGKDRITFGFTIHYNDGDLAPTGTLIYQDQMANLRLKATIFDLLVIEGSHAWFTGTWILDDEKEVGFTIEIDESQDIFYIQIPALDGYEAGGALTGGNVTIH
jgi:hypothetical protein